MVFLPPRRLRDKFWPEPLPHTTSFNGQTVLITGATTGLGLAAAVHFADLGATVLITSRSLSQGNVAKDQIEAQAGIVGQGRVFVMELDLSRYSSCVSFIHTLKATEAVRAGLDVAVLNAGLINTDFVESPEGWEQTIQVNTLSTTLLGLLLLQWMRQKRRDTEVPPHLIFVTSRDHLDPDISNWAEWSADGGILRHFSDKRNWPSSQIDPNYANSKLLLTYAVEQVCTRALGLDGSVDVIVNSVCPGLVSTDLGRSIAKISAFMRLAVKIHACVLGKSADYGARFYVTAARTSQNEHGTYVQSLFSEDEYRTLAAPNLRSETAMQVKVMVWNEIITELKERVPELGSMES